MNNNIRLASEPDLGASVSNQSPDCLDSTSPLEHHFSEWKILQAAHQDLRINDPLSFLYNLSRGL